MGNYLDRKIRKQFEEWFREYYEKKTAQKLDRHVFLTSGKGDYLDDTTLDSWLAFKEGYDAGLFWWDD